MFNLKDPANPDLRAHVVTGGISPAQLVQLSPGDLANSEKAEWRRTREKMHDKEIVLDVETAAKVGGWSGGRWKWGCCRRKEGGGGKGSKGEQPPVPGGCSPQCRLLPTPLAHVVWTHIWCMATEAAAAGQSLTMTACGCGSSSARTLFNLCKPVSTC